MKISAMAMVYLLGGMVLLFFISVLWPWAIGAAWTPTPMPIVRRMLTMAGVNKDDLLYDLGCGDGRIIITAVREFNARAIGVEIEPLRFIFTWIRLRLLGLSGRARVDYGNIFKKNISDATVVVLFLTDKANNRLRRVAFNKLKKGTRVISYLWTFDSWQPVEVDEENKIYLYKV